MRLLTGVTPQFEQVAAQDYMRGDAFRVTGESSLNVEFSKGGARLMAECLDSALRRTREFLELRVPNLRNRRDLIEFVPDVEIRAKESEECRRLAASGELMAAETLPPEDFGDWESVSGQA